MSGGSVCPWRTEGNERSGAPVSVRRLCESFESVVGGGEISLTGSTPLYESLSVNIHESPACGPPKTARSST
jgi:hypothetical protein